MKQLALVLVALSGCLFLSSGSALAAATEFSRGQTTVTEGSNTITVDNNVKFVGYTAGDTLTVTLNFTSTCNVVFSGLILRSPNPFTPHRGVSGAVSNVTGTPAPGSAGTTGSVTFDIQFDTLKHAGKKDFGMAHLSLVLGVDEDCNPATGDADGVDGTTSIGVQLSVSTASHP